MVRTLLLAALVATTASALSIGRAEVQDLYTIELGPGETQVVTEAEKWALKAQGKNFFDITSFTQLAEQSSSASLAEVAAVTYPSSMSQTRAVEALIPSLDKTKMQKNLQTFSDFRNRYYKSSYGKKSSEWLLAQVQSIISDSGAANVTAKPFDHSWAQSSVIATIPGQSDKTIVVGAHQDSINIRDSDRVNARAPGADDDGSGTVTILEAFRVLMTDSKIAAGEAPNTIEFHFYSAEEAGLLGSQAIFQSYATAKRDVKAMLQQDMTGYVKAGSQESVGVITDYVDAGLTDFIKSVVDTYCDIPYVETKCGYACSDHASASRAGYPSAFVIESAFANTDPNIHSDKDTIDTINFNHVREHAKMTLGFAYELAFATL
ncbi:leucine aminopeptidase/pepditase M28/metalloprotease [Pseudomassariella vexata]|uniref:Peptide hydrolase n=1 Tax=Pseudomassariella vexata TaxID=1141098 RepID=A0A1Y2DYK3_9PEZI|nr:leucine aminopeptidase/pepditase M28/metalloprotease [Pseudomassariella vexata]ORY64186.1 leucine aminopeptidase/pepditase M28/metalloprotease [Pseudomassariella vexata]